MGGGGGGGGGVGSVGEEKRWVKPVYILYCENFCNIFIHLH